MLRRLLRSAAHSTPFHKILMLASWRALVPAAVRVVRRTHSRLLFRAAVQSSPPVFPRLPEVRLGRWKGAAPAFPLTRRRLTAATRPLPQGERRSDGGAIPLPGGRGAGVRGYGLSGEAVFPHALGGACPWACRRQDPGAEKAPARERRGAAPAFPLTRRRLTAAARPLPQGERRGGRRASSSVTTPIIILGDEARHRR